MSLLDRLRARLAELRTKTAADRNDLKRAVERHAAPKDIAAKRGRLSGAVDAIHNIEAEIHKAEHPATRVSPQLVRTIQSPNHYAGRNDRIRLIVVHVTDSNREPRDQDAVNIGTYFADPASQVSAHVVVSGDGHTVRCVRDEDTAWHVAGFNNVALGIEQCAHNESRGAWGQHLAQLHETARNVALMAHRHRIPLVHGAVQGSMVTRSGVLQHMELGSYGGGHDDCGPGYPFNEMLDLARSYYGRL